MKVFFCTVILVFLFFNNSVFAETDKEKLKKIDNQLISIKDLYESGVFSETEYKEKELIVKKVKDFTTSSNSKEDINKLNEFSSEWKKTGNIPRDKMDINNRFFNLLDSKFKELGLSKKALIKEQYKNKVSSLKGNVKAINSEQQSIRKKIETLKRKIIQYENNISFFGSDKATKPLLKKAQQQIDNAKTDIENLKEKIQLLNKA